MQSCALQFSGFLCFLKFFPLSADFLSRKQLSFMCRGHLGRGRVRCQRRHLSIACDISSGRRTDAPAKCWGPCASKIRKQVLVFLKAGFSVLAVVPHVLLPCSVSLKLYVGREHLPGWVVRCTGNVAIQAVLPWSSLMRAHGFRRNMPARRRSCVSRSGNQVG